MKVKNPSTGNFEEVYVKALDSLPVGTEVDFTGSASDIPVGWEQIDSKCLVTHTLYNNANGSGSTITLSDSVGNYDYIEIFYNSTGRTQYGIFSIKAYPVDNSLTAVLFLPIVTNGSVFYQSYSRITITDKQLTRDSDWNFAFRPTPSITNTDMSNNIENYITRVVGYKEV